MTGHEHCRQQDRCANLAAPSIHTVHVCRLNMTTLPEVRSSDLRSFSLRTARVKSPTGLSDTHPSTETAEMTVSHLVWNSYGLLIMAMGYLLSRAAYTWRQRAFFFLTLLVLAVITGSRLGVIVASLPALISVVLFEFEEHARRRGNAHLAIRADAFTKFPVVKWDGSSPLVVYDTRRYFFGDAVFDYINEHPDDEHIRLCLCQPIYLQPVDAQDLTLGVAGPDYELPAGVQQALGELNTAIAQCGPIAWEQANIAVDIGDLRLRAKHRSGCTSEDTNAENKPLLAHFGGPPRDQSTNLDQNRLQSRVRGKD